MASETTRIGILGSGNVGQQLGRGLAKHGYAVMLGSREPAKLDGWKASTPGSVATGTFAAAAEFGEILILATSGAATESAIDLAGPSNFAGKLLLDVTNPLDFGSGMPPGLFVGTTDSLGERVQRKLPTAKVVKCFNTMSNTRMIDPQFRDGAPPMFICGNDPESKARATQLVREVGWPGTFDVGGIDGARWLEALVPLWMRVGRSLGTYEHAFSVVR